MVGEPYAQIPVAVLYDGRLSHSARLFYAVLQGHWRQGGECYARYETLAQEFGVADRSVRRYVGELEQAGHIRQRGRGPHKSCVITPTDGPNLAAQQTQDGPEMDSQEPKDGPEMAAHGARRAKFVTDDGPNLAAKVNTPEVNTSPEADLPSGSPSVRGVQGGEDDSRNGRALERRAPDGGPRDIEPRQGRGFVDAGHDKHDRRGNPRGGSRPTLTPGAAEIVAYWRERKGKHCKPRWEPNPAQTVRLEQAVARHGVEFLRARVDWAAEVEAEFIQMLRAADKWAAKEGAAVVTAATGRTNGHAVPVTASRIEGGRTLIPKEPGVYDHGVRCDCGEVYGRMRADCPRCAQPKSELERVTA